MVDKDEDDVATWDGTNATMDHKICFHSKDEVKRAVTCWSIEKKREYYVTQSTKTACSVRCRSLKFPTPRGCVPCGWKARATLKDKDYGLWEMVVWTDAYNCLSCAEGRDHKNVTSTYITRLIVRKVKENYEYAVRDVQTDVHDLLKVKVSYKKAWHGRRKAIEGVYGDWRTNFKELPRYDDL